VTSSSIDGDNVDSSTRHQQHQADTNNGASQPAAAGHSLAVSLAAEVAGGFSCTSSDFLQSFHTPQHSGDGLGVNCVKKTSYAHCAASMSDVEEVASTVSLVPDDLVSVSSGEVIASLLCLAHDAAVVASGAPVDAAPLDLTSALTRADAAVDQQPSEVTKDTTLAPEPAKTHNEVNKLVTNDGEEARNGTAKSRQAPRWALADCSSMVFQGILTGLYCSRQLAGSL
jgi:hypothetical protein